jgi:hypothetical protein
MFSGYLFYARPYARISDMGEKKDPSREELTD